LVLADAAELGVAGNKEVGVAGDGGRKDEIVRWMARHA
jgi:hypothetical protein